uniref:Putative syntaxin-binding protein 2 n=1 Tax=Rhipicephalus microplus TaxID=6941 RepID=A0A6G5AI63_RHIMP
MHNVFHLFVCLCIIFTFSLCSSLSVIFRKPLCMCWHYVISFTCWCAAHCTRLLVLTALYSLVIGSSQATNVAFNPTV